MKKIASQYSASFTAASMAFYEMNAVIPYLLEDNSRVMIKRLEEDASILKIQSLSARKRTLSEIVKRYKTMPSSFWESYLQLDEQSQRLDLFFVILKTYKLLFDFQINYLLDKYNSASPVFSSDEVLIALNEIGANDELVDSWTDETKKKIVSVYLVMLKQMGFVNGENSEISRLDIDKEKYVRYIKLGEDWFLQACLLPLYEIDNIKRLAQ
jgi:hypothetical protein